MSGGLALCWHESCQVDVLGTDDRFINFIVGVEEGAPKWRMTCVYGESRVENRHLMWAKLQGPSNISDLPWLVIGDFNETLWDFENLLVTPRPEPQMVAFKDTLEVCGLVDLGFSGFPFTYDNMRGGQANVKVLLDRTVTSNTRRNMFSSLELVHLIYPCSNHTQGGT